ncbi:MULTISPECIES: ABC transporter ATP-binding protein [unclassified Rhizobium]|uniref:ABC transporter ATP-binding protein n=1 Tax=Rhizobium sp. BK399 TaxID=2587063 RepID=UPI00161B846C|nr:MULTISPECIES: ABC transporter ATP-binding protein [unclassified Rhizobium]
MIALATSRQIAAEQSVLSVSNLTTSFLVEGRWKPVVQDVSFQIAPKETLAIVGESGSGKSVTSLSIMRLLPKQSCRIEGNIVLGGTDILSLTDRQMRQVRGRDAAMVFQEPMTSLNPIFTIGDQISEALLCHNKSMSYAEAKTEALRLMDKVRIPAAASRYSEFPHQFSGGMRQRVVIAMALASRPKLLIADEPTTALDVTIQGQVLDLIKSLQDEDGMSVLFITHDMGVVAEMADQTIVMYRGQCVESGQTEQVFNIPNHAYTRSLLASVPRLGAMRGHTEPLKFPIIDMESGIQTPQSTVVTTVSHEHRALLEVSSLSTRFDIHSGSFGRLSGRVHAVEDVSFSIRPGETLSLVGESGCGKSTTGRSIIGLVKPTSGAILFEGQDVSTLGKQEMRSIRRSIQMIFQDPYASLNPRMRIGDAIAEPYLAHGLGNRLQSKARVAELLSQVGLSPDMAERFPHEFSGGQRQRISIARALALEPKLIIADESVSALDVSVKAQVVNLLLELQAKLGLSFLFISHDMAIVERVSHRVAVMYLGEIVEIGPRSAIFENAQHPYTRRLIHAVPVPDPSRRAIRRETPAEELKSPLRTLQYIPAKPSYRVVSAGHLVRSDMVSFAENE